MSERKSILDLADELGEHVNEPWHEVEKIERPQLITTPIRKLSVGLWDLNEGEADE